MSVWQDVELLFFTSQSNLKLTKGEELISLLEPVEDIQGNPGQMGFMRLTNLRLVWELKQTKSLLNTLDSAFSNKPNLSIGFDTVNHNELKVLPSQLEQQTYSLTIRCSFANKNYVFRFETAGKNASDFMNTFNKIWKAYDNSRVFRDIKMRGAFVSKGELVGLPGEKAFSKHIDVTNMAVDVESACKGAVFLTNYRFLWYSLSQERYNISIPYLLINKLKTKVGKTGPSLTILLHKRGGGNIVGFLGPNVERISAELKKHLKRTREMPGFGINSTLGQELTSSTMLMQSVAQSQVTDEVQIVDSEFNDMQMQSNAYQADDEGGKNTNERTQIEFNPELMLATEKLPPGASISDLWKIIK